MGETLKKPIIAMNSYVLFYCRPRTGDLHVISDSYEFNVRSLFEKLSKTSKVIVDGGANIGKYSILASKVNPHSKVFAIEPERENFEVLTKNKLMNGVHNLEVLKLALNDKKGEIKLYKPHMSNSTWNYMLKSPGKECEFEIVQGIPWTGYFVKILIFSN